MLNLWLVLVGYLKPIFQVTAIINSAAVPKFECHFWELDLVERGIPLRKSMSQEYGLAVTDGNRCRDAQPNIRRNLGES